jgi:hypothetical protein
MATGLQLNWTAVGFTPSGGSLTTITRVTSVGIGTGGQLLPFSGDNDRFPTVIHKDARGATNGDIVYTLINAVVASPDANGPHGSYGSGTISWQAFSSDGSTNPLSFTRA